MRIPARERDTTPDATSLGEKVSSTYALVPLAEERMQISNLISEARRVCLSENLIRALQWTMYNRIASVEQNMDAVPDLDRPLWIEFANAPRTRHVPPEMLADRMVPERVGFLFASTGNGVTFTMAVLYDDGTMGSIPDTTMAVGHFAVDELAHNAIQARDTYRLTNEYCMRRLIDRAKITIPLGFQKEMDAAAEGKVDVLSRAYATAHRDLVGEIPFAMTCLLSLSCTNVQATRAPFARVETMDLKPPMRLPRIVSKVRDLMIRKEPVGFRRMGHPLGGRLALDVPDLSDWTFDPASYLKDGAGDDESTDSNRPNEGTSSSANV